MNKTPSKIVAFRGLSGEVIYSFISPATLISALPVFIFFFLFGAAISFIPEALFPLHLLLIYLVSAVAVSRYALPASRGIFNCGWFNSHIEKGETIAFTLRYAALTLLWGIPCVILIGLASLYATQGLTPGNLSFENLAIGNSGISGILMLAVFLIMLFAPTMSYIIATATNHVHEVIGLNPWRELLFDEFPNLVVFYASLFGGIFAFWVVYAIPLGLFTLLLSFLSPTAAGIIAIFIFSLPGAMMPILIGRLAGALVHGSQLDYEIDDEVINSPERANSPERINNSPELTNNTPEPSTSNSGYPFSQSSPSIQTEYPPNMGNNYTSETSPTSPQTPASSSVSQTSDRPASDTSKSSISLSKSPVTPAKDSEDSTINTDLLTQVTPNNQPDTIEQKLLKKIDAIPPHQLNNSITICNSRLNNRPEDALVNAEMTILKARAQQTEGLVDLASKAIHLNLKENYQLLVDTILLSLTDEILVLNMELADYRACANRLIEMDHLYKSALCMTGAKRVLPSTQELEIFLLNLAMKANKKKQQNQTVGILKLFKQHFPQSKHMAKVEAFLKQVDGPS